MKTTPDSPYCKIITKNGTRVVQRFPRKRNIAHEYPRLVPEKKVLAVLNGTNLPVPKLLSVCKSYILQKYIEGDLMWSIYQDYNPIDKNMIDQIADNIFDLSKIDASDLSVCAKYKTPRDFFTLQLKNTTNIFYKYHRNLRPIYDSLNIDKRMIKRILPFMDKINDSRNLALIHGDRHKMNMIIKNGRVFFIDWELGCLGDIAYDIAFHLHQMAYTEEDERYFLNRISQKFGGGIIEDVNVYRLFCLLRSTLYHVFWTYSSFSKNWDNQQRQLLHFTRRLHRLREYEEFKGPHLPETVLRGIFEKYKGRIFS